MKLGKLAVLAALCCGTSLIASGQRSHAQETIAQVGYCDCGEAVCGCETCEPACEPACGTEFFEPECCDTGCDSCCDGGCDSGCQGGCPMGGWFGDCSLCGDCCLGDPYTLFGEHAGFSIGGWIQMGYHNRANSLFNSRPDEFQLHQAWIYAEKALDTSCGFDLGGRVDYMYGTDSQDTQAFGTDPRGWDNDWDNGPDYGRAMPQLYLEAGYGDFSVKAGHFYTIIGWEVVTAPDNFFYSHAYTMYNSEPFTHTGALATYTASEDITVYGGYVLGWDSGFDDNGDAFLGGVSATLTDSLTLTYATVGGRFGDLPLGTVERGYMHSIVADFSVTDNLQYIFQSDLLDSHDASGVTVRDTFGLNNYLIYTVSDCVAWGSRFEWYQNEGVYTNPGQTADIYQLTLGLNYRPHANLLFRPEIRWDWVENNTAVLAAGNNVVEPGQGDDQTTFGFDAILTF